MVQHNRNLSMKLRFAQLIFVFDMPTGIWHFYNNHVSFPEDAYIFDSSNGRNNFGIVSKKSTSILHIKYYHTLCTIKILHDIDIIGRTYVNVYSENQICLNK